MRTDEGERPDGEARFATLVEHASDAVVVLSTEGEIRFASSPIARILGWSPEELIGQPLFHVLHPDDAAVLAGSVLESRSAPGLPVARRVRAVNKNGAHRAVDIVLTNFLDDASIAGLVANVRDVTETTRVEEALRNAEERLRILTEHTWDVVMVLDEAGDIRFSSPSLAHVFGHSESETYGTNIASLVHPDDTEAVLARLREQSARPEPVPAIEFRMSHHAGGWRHVEALANNLLADPTVQGIVVTIRDITERRRAEQSRNAQRGVLELVATGAPLAEALSVLTGMVESATGDAVCVVHLIDEVGLLRLGAAPQVPSDQTAAIDGAATATSPWARAAAGSVRVVTGDVTAEREWAGLRPLATVLGGRRFLAEPIMSSSGHAVLGTITLIVCSERAPEDHGSTVHEATKLAAIAIERQQSEARLVHQARHDHLTGLPNRMVLLERLDQALQRTAALDDHTTVGLLYIDLDLFNLVNDTLGHDAGDALVVAVTHRLEAALPGALLARVGGDEFVALLDRVGDERQAIGHASAVMTELKRPFLIAAREVFVTASMGIALAQEQDLRPEDLLRDADTAVHLAKQRGRNRWEVASPSLRAHALERFEMVAALRRALDDDEFTVHYQPVVDLTTLAITGIEALARWRRADGTMIPPAGFIPLAEATGLIVPLGDRVLRQAAVEAAPWVVARDTPLRVSVNLSARQLLQPAFPQRVEKLLADAGLPPSALTLELTESVLIDGDEAAIEVLFALKEIGVQFGIDDFGTGYSSLSYVKRFPVDLIKLDRTFVAGLGRHPEDAAIVSAVVSLAASLGMLVVAEGVETPAHLAQLRMLGCDLAQGYLFSPPQPGRDIEALLALSSLWAPPPQGESTEVESLEPTGIEVTRSMRCEWCNRRGAVVPIKAKAREFALENPVLCDVCRVLLDLTVADESDPGGRRARLQALDQVYRQLVRRARGRR